MVNMTRYIKILLAFLFISAPAVAQTPPALDFKGRYDFTLAAVPFGAIDVSMSQGPGYYRAVSDITTVGIAKVFVQHKSHTESRGTGADFKYPEVTYESKYETKGKPKSARFVKRGGVIVEDYVQPADHRTARTPVSVEAKSKAWDPVALALGMRIELARIIKGGGKDFSLDYYDGRRLTRGNFSYVGEQTVKIKGVKYPVYVVTGSREPIAGFTDKELKRMAQKEPTLTVYFTKDTLVPLKLELPLGLAMASATLKM